MKFRQPWIKIPYASLAFLDMINTDIKETLPNLYLLWYSKSSCFELSREIIFCFSWNMFVNWKRWLLFFVLWVVFLFTVAGFMVVIIMPSSDLLSLISGKLWYLGDFFCFSHTRLLLSASISHDLICTYLNPLLGFFDFGLFCNFAFL